MMEMRGAPVAKAITENCKEKIAILKEKGIMPTLAIVRVGNRGDDEAYEKGAEKRFFGAGAQVKKIVLPEDVSQAELEKTVNELNSDKDVHGILIFRPLPKQIDEAVIKQLISADKDIDGMSYSGIGKLVASKNFKGQAYAPCTPTAVVEMLDYYGIDVTGMRITVVGRSSVVGLPLAIMLMQKNATVTLCHTKTKDLREECRKADIIVVAAGRAKTIGAEHVSKGQVLVDVGINVIDDKICGDIDYDGVAKYASAITPVPGGVGAVTTSVLLKHTVESAEKTC